MSNEYKDWLQDKIQDIILERKLADETLNTSTTRFVNGIKNGKPVRFEVWFDDSLCAWCVEERKPS